VSACSFCGFVGECISRRPKHYDSHWAPGGPLNFSRAPIPITGTEWIRLPIVSFEHLLIEHLLPIRRNDIFGKLHWREG
jgi:hypothetical protein